MSSMTEAGAVSALHGIGGTLALYPDRVRIIRQGFWFTAANLVLHVEREMDTVILLRDLVGVHFVRSLLAVQFIRLTYPGCPAPTGRYMRDALAENAFMYSLTDSRPVLAYTHEISRAASTVACERRAARQGAAPGDETSENV